MRAVRIETHGGPEVLNVLEIERPSPSDRELLVDVAAAGINPIDTYFREGSFSPVSLPFTPGTDFSGTVVAVGDDVSGFGLGDRVFGTGIGNERCHGSYAEYATVPADLAVRLPDSVDITEAGAAGVVAATAWRAMIEYGGLIPAERCLVHGGAGGVGHVAVQLAAAVQARVLTTADPSYHDALSRLGARSTFAYDRSTLADEVQQAVDGGVDVILDHRIDEYLQLDTEVAASNARIIGIGGGPSVELVNAGLARSKDLTVRLMGVFNIDNLRTVLDSVLHLLKTDALSIEIAETYSLDVIKKAHQDLTDKSFLGKLVCVP